MHKEIPKKIGHISDTLQKANFQAFLVGGCVRDILCDRAPKDWDIATNAKPEDVQELFEHTFYENEFGTVGVVQDDVEDEILKTVEVTTYRTETTYSDSRHPDQVVFSDTIEEDLARRDFTMNAIALTLPVGELSVSKGTFVDPYDGQKDAADGIIRAVGNPIERFGEDALRMLRAVRFAAELGFVISKETGEAIQKTAQQIDKIASERIRDELVRIIMSPEPMKGLLLSHDLMLLKNIIPELLDGEGIDQSGIHVYDVLEHSLRTLQGAADKGWGLEVRLAALFHDIGKPHTREKNPAGMKEWRFHNHDIVGATLTHEILTRLRFQNDIVKSVRKLVRWHMFFSDTEQITHAAVRRMIRNVGTERIFDLMNLRIADRIGMKRPKEEPYRFRKYQSMIEEVLRDPVSPKQLKVNGSRIMEISDEKPGPRIGWIQYALLEDILEDPKKNTAEYLEKRVLELVKLPDEELKKLGRIGLESTEEKESEMVKKIRGKYHVQ